jgi:hypothetical protein
MRQKRKRKVHSAMLTLTSLDCFLKYRILFWNARKYNGMYCVLEETE